MQRLWRPIRGHQREPVILLLLIGRRPCRRLSTTDPRPVMAAVEVVVERLLTAERLVWLENLVDSLWLIVVVVGVAVIA